MPGRPTTVDMVLTTEPDGTTLTLGGAYCRNLALGTGPTAAAKAVGINPSTARLWRSNGRQALLRLETEGGDPTDIEAPYLAFLAELEGAEAKAKAALLQGILDAGTQTQKYRKVQIRKELRDGVMVEVDRTETVEERPAQWTALAWMAERRWPNEFGRRVAVDVQHTDDEGAGERARDLAGEAEAYLQGMADAAPSGVIDVTEAPPSGQA